jgi:hypothetical protein
MCIPLLPHACYMSCQSHPHWLNLIILNPSAWRFKFRSRVSPAVLFSARNLNSDRELLYSSLFLKYMRYKHETFTKMILKDGFISCLFNNIGGAYLSNGSGWIDRLSCTGRKTPEPCFCMRPCATNSLNSAAVNATRISNTLQKAHVSISYISCAVFQLCFILTVAGLFAHGPAMMKQTQIIEVHCLLCGL